MTFVLLFIWNSYCHLIHWLDSSLSFWHYCLLFMIIKGQGYGLLTRKVDVKRNLSSYRTVHIVVFMSWLLPLKLQILSMYTHNIEKLSLWGWKGESIGRNWKKTQQLTSVRWGIWWAHGIDLLTFQNGTFYFTVPFSVEENRKTVG